MAELNNMPLRQKIADLLSKEKFAVLASWDGEQPYNALVAYIFTEDLKSIIFATREDTKKYQNIAKYPYVSLLIDNRTNDKKDLKDAVALTVSAKARQIEKKEYFNHYINRFPDLKEFLQDPKTTLVRLEIQQYIYVYQFQEVLKLKM